MAVTILMGTLIFKLLELCFKWVLVKNIVALRICKIDSSRKHVQICLYGSLATCTDWSTNHR